jgi:hypothetical protein
LRFALYHRIKGGREVVGALAERDEAIMGFVGRGRRVPIAVNLA